MIDLATIVPLPPLPDPPPVDPPDPAVDAHAYNVWLARWQNYRWLLGQHTRRECALAIDAFAQTVGDSVASILDQYDRQHRRRMFFEFVATRAPRIEDTPANYPAKMLDEFTRLSDAFEPPTVTPV